MHDRLQVVYIESSSVALSRESFSDPGIYYTTYLSR